LFVPLDRAAAGLGMDMGASTSKESLRRQPCATGFSRIVSIPRPATIRHPRSTIIAGKSPPM
jgi:hypothetical protein